MYYFEINQKKVTVHYGRGETFSFYMSLAELKEQLVPYACYRVHRSYIIKLSNVMRKVASSLLMANGDNIPIGRTYVQSVKAFIDSNENAVV
ncbi:LytR/AlgR family response regulator transcription factor [Eubacterium aggregans]|uniref:LytR/AlgR family response regulator transcription factor n=2 Tax=Eubacterium aggregans TaxID=81409 RepID=UPI003F378BBA